MTAVSWTEILPAPAYCIYKI